ncbi:nucleoside hydrolase-like domain-containing protein [Brachybacterium paraconglomeratum]|uniref:nucleoside hydrolase-like domain-containing protein n=1 Tax=Brachybacterium paraconglomeratum TaxID=173362 RepID=UPI0037C8F9A9
MTFPHIARQRLVVLTDIGGGLENDDIQSMARLLLYADGIDLEGLVAVTSCWQRRGGRPKHAALIRRLIDRYAAVLPHLREHSSEYPDATFLHSLVTTGVPVFGAGPGSGFGQSRFDAVPGVQLLVKALTSEDARPLWVALWGGANTLAQALWMLERSETPGDLAEILSKLRVHAISDQDAGGHWIRDHFGERIFTIVSPSPAVGDDHYRFATWPGISADSFTHGSDDGVGGGGFGGADASLVSRKWIRANIRQGKYGRGYPLHRYLMEGDTPSFLGLIPNGLNVPERPDLGGWGGRYEYRIPTGSRGGRRERAPIWTETSDTVTGIDGEIRTSPQASIWRWRNDFQNDFAARIRWTTAPRYDGANHPPRALLAHADVLDVDAGELVVLDAGPSVDPDGDALTFRWSMYPELDAAPSTAMVTDGPRCRVHVAEGLEGATLHVVVAVSDDGTPPLTAYRRVTLRVNARRS